MASPTVFTLALVAYSFRRLLADQSFLRQYRSLHPPLLIGFIDGDEEEDNGMLNRTTTMPRARLLSKLLHLWLLACFYKKVFNNKLLKFSMSTTEFSTLDLPLPSMKSWK
ncbi:hypothetical protein EJB05_11849, partial [Eragrostis curvula]